MAQGSAVARERVNSCVEREASIVGWNASTITESELMHGLQHLRDQKWISGGCVCCMEAHSLVKSHESPMTSKWGYSKIARNGVLSSPSSGQSLVAEVDSLLNGAS